MKRFLLMLCLLLLTGCGANQMARGLAGISGDGLTVLPPSLSAAENPTTLNGTNPNGGRAAAWSPDGSSIAFLSSTLHAPPDLWVMNADGSGVRRLTTRGVLGFRWQKDGKSIAFTSRRKGFEEVLVINLDGTGEQRFPGLPPGASVPEYSPDGSLFAFTAPAEQNVRDLWIGTADGSRVEAVTEKISVRSIFWSPDSRTVYYEAGKSYGVGIWEMNLSTMESKALLSKYIGTPEFSSKAGLVAYPYPTNPGEFEVHTMKLDGTADKVLKAPRLAGRSLAWDSAGNGVFYLGQDLAMVEQEKDDAEAAKPAAPHDKKSQSGLRPVGVTALWHLDLATGLERRVSPEGLHIADFAVSPAGDRAVCSGLLEKSDGPEIYVIDLASGVPLTLISSRPSAWMPIPSHDASQVAFFSNEGGLDTLKVVRYTGEEKATYPGFVLEGDVRLFWLPVSDGLVVFSGRGVFAFTEKGAIEFPGKADHRSYLYADASIQEDKLLISAIPRYGQNPGLYMQEAVDGTFKQTDLRYPTAPELAAEIYLQPKWSLDGSKIAFTDGLDVWTMKADGTARKWITRFAQDKQEGKGREAAPSFPVWSVKGDMICYTVTVYEEKRILRELWIAKEDGTGERKLFAEVLDSQFQVFQPEYTNLPFFDATDERIIFTATDNGIPNIFAVETKSGKLHRLTSTGAVFPALLPEEGVILYTSLEGNTESLWMMNSDGSSKRPFVVKPSEKPKQEIPVDGTTQQPADKPV